MANKKAAKAPRTKAGTSKEAAEQRRVLYAKAYVANGGNKTQSAVAAGFSPKSAERQGIRMSGDVRVKTLISEFAQKVANKYDLTAELAARSIVQELSFDPAKLYNDDGSLKAIPDLDEDTRMALVGVEFEEIGGGDSPLVRVRKVKWANRASARDHLMKHLGMFEKDNAQRNPFAEMTDEQRRARIAELQARL